MDWLIWLGAAMSICGVAALVWCILTVWRAKRAGLTDDVLKDRVRRVVPVNMAALLLSVFGLMLVILGISL